ncbi:MAG: ABC transporter ATP-binding protein [Chloroflexota bacterium]
MNATASSTITASTVAGSAIAASGLTVIRSGRRILDDVELVVPRGAVVGIIGPNGAGKSTLLGCIFRHIAYQHGQITIEGRDVQTLPRRDLARLVAAVPQDTPLVFDLTVEEIVAAGRIPHSSTLGALGGGSAADREIVDQSLQRVNLAHLRHRSAATLSGGERQRALLGRALAQAAPILILDEPTNHLDLANQEHLLGLIRDHAGTALVAIHDLNLAAEYCDRIVVMADGRVVTSGAPEEVVTPTMLREVFRVRTQVVPHPESGRPHVIMRARDA